MTRKTFAGQPGSTLFFYDGGECVRNHDEHARAVKRARGYSCEELGGLAVGWQDEFPRLERLSINSPLFVSPYGSGCSRYTRTLTTAEGIYAFWQQSQKNLSQPLVENFVSMQEIQEILQR